LDRAKGLADIAAAAAGRCEQGLRVLEEISKFLYPTTATNTTATNTNSMSIESVRYRVYDLNAALLLTLRRDLDFLKRAQLYVLIDCQLPENEFADRIRAISEAGVDLIQIRDKSADTIRILEATQLAVETVSRDQTRIIVNDRIDIASCSLAWGAHVGQEDLPTNAARRLLAGHQILGLSTHNLDQIEKALHASVDYIGCGPTFPSSTKSFDSFSGLRFLEEASKLLQERGSPMPAFAIGGIDPENLAQVIDSGFSRIAVSSCVWKAASPAKVAGELKKMLQQSRGGRSV
jgi:thiamine-phosphate pyrophosphorylase